MSRHAAFDAHPRRYEAWFERHAAAYDSELLTVRAFLPLSGLALEIGVGSGRFAAPLGVRVGVDPSAAMLEHARARGAAGHQAGRVPGGRFRRPGKRPGAGVSVSSG